MTSDHHKDFSDFIDEEIQEDLDYIEKEILSHLEETTSDLAESGLYLIRGGGKRVRPAFVALAYRSLGGKDIPSIAPISAAIEYIHTASLIHDDINDESDKRRGQPTVNKQYGNIRALVTGDYLFVKAFELGGRYDYEIIEIIARACTSLAEGEILQNSMQFNPDMGFDTYLEIINRKTASLITACLEVGAVLGGATPEQREALVEYGHCVGITFQITDDILDVTGEEGEMGKSPGTDLRDGTPSLPFILSLSIVKDEDREFLKRTLAGRENTDGDINWALEIIKGCGAVEKCYEMAHEYADKALEALYRLPDSKYQDHFSLAINGIMERCM